MGENYWSSVLNTLNVLADPLHIREGILLEYYWEYYSIDTLAQDLGNFS